MRSRIVSFLVLLAVVIQMAAASPLAASCSSAGEVETKNGIDKCKELETNATASRCSDGQCITDTSQHSVAKRQFKQYRDCNNRRHHMYEPPDDHCRPNCTVDELCIKDAFAAADIVFRGRLVRDKLFGTTHVKVVFMVQLIMKSTPRLYTPGGLFTYVPLRESWVCDCPGRYELEQHETYLVTGFVEPVRNVNRVVIDHRSIVRRWHETILVDILANKDEYPNLSLSFELWRYLAYFVPEKDHHLFDRFN